MQIDEIQKYEIETETFTFQAFNNPQGLLVPLWLDGIFAGWGACRSCECRGYIKSGDGSTCKNCGHHFSQHR